MLSSVGFKSLSVIVLSVISSACAEVERHDTCVGTPLAELECACAPYGTGILVWTLGDDGVERSSREVRWECISIHTCCYILRLPILVILVHSRHQKPFMSY